MFSCEYCQIFRSTFFIEHLRGCFFYSEIFNYFAVNYFGSFVNCSIQFRCCLQTNGVIESDVKESIKKQLGNTTKRIDDGKTEATQIIGLIQPMLT